MKKLSPNRPSSLIKKYMQWSCDIHNMTRFLAKNDLYRAIKPLWLKADAKILQCFLCKSLSLNLS